MRILLTGGTGYIGSHAAVALVEAGFDIVCYDNFSNSSPEVSARLGQICGTAVTTIEGDVRDAACLRKVFQEHQIGAVIHFAGLKSVAESVENPLLYYSNNVHGTSVLLEVMRQQGVKAFVFSSSATVYGAPQYLPLDENHPIAPMNPYGRSKAMVEEMLADLALSDPSWSLGVLRYFNPVGAHPSGLIGEAPKSTPNNLMPYLAKVAAGELDILSVYGQDYDTPDGTGIRDYIHISDLVDGHISALRYLLTNLGSSSTWNLGTGQGTSVLELVKAFERVNRVEVPYQMVGRRPGDTAISYASAEKAAKELNWKASRGLDDMCRSSWQFEVSGQVD